MSPDLSIQYVNLASIPLQIDTCFGFIIQLTVGSVNYLALAIYHTLITLSSPNFGCLVQPANWGFGFNVMKFPISCESFFMLKPELTWSVSYIFLLKISPSCHLSEDFAYYLLSFFHFQTTWYIIFVENDSQSIQCSHWMWFHGETL